MSYPFIVELFGISISKDDEKLGSLLLSSLSHLHVFDYLTDVVQSFIFLMPRNDRTKTILFIKLCIQSRFKMVSMNIILKRAFRDYGNSHEFLQHKVRWSINIVQINIFHFLFSRPWLNWNVSHYTSDIH